MAAHAYALIDACVSGFALQEAALPFDAGDDLGELATTLFEPYPSDAYPHLAEFTIKHVLRADYEFGAGFDFGLDLILDDLAAAAHRES